MEDEELYSMMSLLMVANPRIGGNSKGEYSKECWQCKHKRPVPGNAHIKCVKPDLYMSGDKHGIKNGWFMYPLLFDPVWKTKKCDNFQDSVNRAISQETQSK